MGAVISERKIGGKLAEHFLASEQCFLRRLDPDDLHCMFCHQPQRRGLFACTIDRAPRETLRD